MLNKDKRKWDGLPETIYYGSGFGGNYIIIIPDNNIVIVARWIDSTKIGDFVKKVIESGYQITVIPGATAPISALVVSGFSTQRWCMEGFLPRKGESRSRRIKEIAEETRTTVLFESPHRLAATLKDLYEECGGDRQIAIVRELTKIHEEIFRGSLAESLVWTEKKIKGEIVIVLEADNSISEIDDDRLQVVLREILDSGVSTKDAAEEASRRLNVSRRRAYSTALDLRAE